MGAEDLRVVIEDVVVCLELDPTCYTRNMYFAR